MAPLEQRHYEAPLLIRLQRIIYKITINDTLGTGLIRPLAISVDELLLSQITSEGTPAWQPGDPWKDTRDGQTYKTMTFGTQVWMTENFNYIAPDSWRNPLVTAENEKKYGRLYTCSAAVENAPAGWRLATREEWKILEDYLKANGLTGLEVNGFNGVLAGDYSVSDNRYFGFKEYGYYKSTSGNVFPCYTTGCSGIYSGGYSCELYASSIRYIKN
jgi:uncharacterized protein (TIGR02145 family)